MAVQRWVFHDAVAVESYTVAMNPDAFTGPDRDKKIGYSASAGPGGSVLIYEGRDGVPEFTASGTILVKEHYLALEDWTDRRVPITITDDLGRVFTCYLKSFHPKRVRSARYPWKHTFDLTATVMGVTNP